jgi:myo-inositol-1(or 4)-monophosphatase
MSFIDPRYLQTAVEAAHAGADVLRAWSGRFTVSEKSKANLVTEADRESQKVIYNIIKSQFPDHGFLGEEEGLDEQAKWSEEAPGARWIVDPLDGTTNYVHGFPYYAVTIGLEIAGELVVGLVYDLTRDDMYTAVKGQGARCNERTIRVSNIRSLDQALVMASMPPAPTPDDPALTRFLKVFSEAQSVQRTGSAALNLAYVACGRADGFWSTSLKPWDMAGGALLVTEAGGIVTDLYNKPFSQHQPTIACSPTASLHQEMLGIISPDAMGDKI